MSSDLQNYKTCHQIREQTGTLFDEILDHNYGLLMPNCNSIVFGSQVYGGGFRSSQIIQKPGQNRVRGIYYCYKLTCNYRNFLIVISNHNFNLQDFVVNS